MTRRSPALLAAIAVLTAACGGTSVDRSDALVETDPAVEVTGVAITEPLRIPNRGDSSEGHTPRTFAGSGTGLFTGDNLNPNFPAGAGIQILLTFDLPAGLTSPSTAELTSSALTERGDAFAALGPLQAEPVSYSTFAPELFDLAAAGPSTTCIRINDSTISCDVLDAVKAAVSADQPTVQLRVQFSKMSDNDGSQDLALFFLSDSNSNEPGIFFLEIS